MRVLWSIFALISGLGFLASLVAHIAGYLGISEPFGFDPWPLHVGIFIVWLPAVIVAQRLSKDFPQKDMWKAALRGCPKWMRLGLYGLFAYAFASFAYFFLATMQGAGGDEDPEVVRGFSGHWLVFYYAAFAILYSAIQVAGDDPTRRCSNGHLVKPADQFCPQCGDRVGSSLEGAS
jgi:hypothetical protein